MSQQEEEFYVGYSDQQPRNTIRFVKRIGLMFVLIALGFVGVFAFNQQPFANGTFELGSVTSIKGVFHRDPVPMLRVESDGGTYRNVVLLGYGKWGAWNTIEAIEEKVGDLENYELELNGTLIYYDGKTLFQMEPEIEGNYQKLTQRQAARSSTQLGSISLKGEIVDPKCYFGVMKPGKGKIHRSCAVRCISGGIPPVFMVMNEAEVAEYYLILGADGEPINDEVLDYVGKPVQLDGELEQWEDWFVLKVDPVAGLTELGESSKIYTANH